MLQIPSTRRLPLTCCAETQLERRNGAFMESACTSAAHPANLVLAGITLSWKVRAWLRSSLIRSKTPFIGRKSCLWGGIWSKFNSSKVEIHFGKFEVENPVFASRIAISSYQRSKNISSNRKLAVPTNASPHSEQAGLDDPNVGFDRNSH